MNAPVGFRAGDRVLASKERDWPWGETHGYTRNPGTVAQELPDGVLAVMWQDGHRSIHTPDELVPFQSA